MYDASSKSLSWQIESLDAKLNQAEQEGKDKKHLQEEVQASRDKIIRLETKCELLEKVSSFRLYELQLLWCLILLWSCLLSVVLLFGFMNFSYWWCASCSYLEPTDCPLFFWAIQEVQALREARQAEVQESFNRTKDHEEFARQKEMEISTLQQGN